MGTFDDIKAAVAGHEDQVEQVIDKVGDLVDEKTEGKFAAQVDQAQNFLKDKIDDAKA